MTTAAAYRKIIGRYGLSINVPTLEIAEIGYDTDTFTGRLGDGTTTPPRFMTTKSTGNFVYQTNVTFNNVTANTLNGISINTLNSGAGLVYRTAVNGQFRPVTFSSSDNTLSFSTTTTDTTGLVDARISQSLAEDLAFAKLGPWLSVLAIASVPPTSPALGDTYIVGSNASGDFTGQDHKYAVKIQTGWAFKSVINNSLARIPSGVFYERTSAGWETFDFNSSHNHTIAQITGLQDTLDALGSAGSAVQKFNHYMEASRSGADVYSALYTNPISLVSGLVVYFKVDLANLGSTPSLKINSLNSIPLKKLDGTQLGVGDIVANGIVGAVYIHAETSFRIFSQIVSSQTNNIWISAINGSNNLSGNPSVGSLSNYYAGLIVSAIISSPNTGAVSLNISSLGPVEVVNIAGQPLKAGDLTSGILARFMYDGLKFRYMKDIIRPFPPGVVSHISATTPPAGWLKANGATLNIADFPALFAVLGTRHGGNGTTTFNLPDLRGEFIRGWDDSRGVDLNRTLGSNQIGSYIVGDSSFPDEVVWPVYVSDSRSAFGWDPVYSVPAPHLIRALIGQGVYLPQTGVAESHGGTTRPRNVSLLAIISTGEQL